MLEDFKKIPAHQNFAAADRQIENAGVRHLIEQVLDFGGGHFAVVVVIQIAVDTPFIASVGHVQLNAQRDVQPERLSNHFRQSMGSWVHLMRSAGLSDRPF